MKIAFFEIEGWEEPILKQAFPDDEIVIMKERIERVVPASHLAQRDFDVISAFMDSPVTVDIAKQYPNLKLVTTRSTGYEHLDVNGLAGLGIKAAYVPGYGDNTVAEFAFGLLLSLSRRIYRAIDQIKETESFSQEGLRGTDLKGKIMGVVGTGRIGREMIKMAKGFGMEVLAVDPFPNEAAAKELGFSYVPLEELLGKSDAITFHCPYTLQTHHLLNKNNIDLLKKGVYIVNTSRGAVIETEALALALENGIVAGAGLDVLEEEGEIKNEINILASGSPSREALRVILQDHILMKMPNVLITPHIAFDSWEAVRRILEITIGNIKAFKEGREENIIKVN
jgi:D-lactate dehydrogenase